MKQQFPFMWLDLWTLSNGDDIQKYVAIWIPDMRVEFLDTDDGLLVWKNCYTKFFAFVYYMETIILQIDVQERHVRKLKLRTPSRTDTQT